MSVIIYSVVCTCVVKVSMVDEFWFMFSVTQLTVCDIGVSVLCGCKDRSLKRGLTLIDHFTVVCSVTWPLNFSEAELS